MDAIKWSRGNGYVLMTSAQLPIFSSTYGYVNQIPIIIERLQLPLVVLDIPGNISNLGFKRNHSSGILTAFWDPLPTLDITGRDPDIIYHVEIFKTTCGQSILISDEDVTESIANNSLDLMETYRAVVIPRNNVPGYIDGPNVLMQGQNNVHVL